MQFLMVWRLAAGGPGDIAGAGRSPEERQPNRDQ